MPAADSSPDATHRILTASLLTIAARLRSHGANRAEIKATLQDHLDSFGGLRFDPGHIDAIATEFAAVSPNLAVSTAQDIISILPVSSDAAAPFPVHSGRSIERETAAAVEWIVEPWAAAGALTGITGRPKVGKTTFTLDLVAAFLAGRPFLSRHASYASPSLTVGSPTQRGGPGVKSAVYLTEQPPSSFRSSLERAGLLGNEALAVVFWHEAMSVPWPRVVAAAGAICRERAARLLVVDTLSQWAGMRGDMENQAGEALAAVAPLQQLAAAGISVIFLQHERKSGGDTADAGRGSSAFAGAVDTLISFRRPPYSDSAPSHPFPLPSPLEGEGPGMGGEAVEPPQRREREESGPRREHEGRGIGAEAEELRLSLEREVPGLRPDHDARGMTSEGRGPAQRPSSRRDIRVLLALSRFESVPPETYIERSPAGFTIVGESADFAAQQTRAAILAALPSGAFASLEQLTQTCGLGRMAARRAINVLLATGEIRRLGSGRRSDPYRYGAVDEFLVT